MYGDLDHFPLPQGIMLILYIYDIMVIGPTGKSSNDSNLIGKTFVSQKMGKTNKQKTPVIFCETFKVPVVWDMLSYPFEIER